jgi:hypothetical protein
MSLVVGGCASASVHADGVTGSVAWHAIEFHLVVDRQVLLWGDRTSLCQVTYRQADKAVWEKLSDHCPVLVELWIR